jgi:nicotinamidase/pyrazinamidase
VRHSILVDRIEREVHAAQIVPVLDRYITLFASRGLPVVVTRDWHPGGHMSFDDRGGPWPPHCIAGTEGAQFARGLATDYCVLFTVRDALRHGYRVFLLLDAIRAVNREPGDGDAAMATMLGLGAQPARIEDLAPARAPHG